MTRGVPHQGKVSREGILQIPITHEHYQFAL